MSTALDSNIVIDLFAGSVPTQSKIPNWSLSVVTDAMTRGPVTISIIVFAEVSIAFQSFDDALQALASLGIVEPVSPTLSALHLAGLAHANYRRNGGARERTLPDFLIGADALTRGQALITRDTSRYASYFPDLKLITPSL